MNTIDHWEDSETYWSWSIETTNNNHYAHIKLGEHYESKGFKAMTKKQYLRAHEINPSEFLYVIYLGNIYVNDDPDKAWHYYRKLLNTALAPTDIIYKMGLTFIVNHEFSKANAFFQHIVDNKKDFEKNTPVFFLSHLYLAHLFSILNNSEESLQNLSKALNLVPEKYRENCEHAHKILIDINLIVEHDGTINYLQALCKK